MQSTENKEISKVKGEEIIDYTKMSVFERKVLEYLQAIYEKLPDSASNPDTNPQIFKYLELTTKK